MRLRQRDPDATLHTSRRASGPLWSYELAGRIRDMAPPVVVCYCHPPTTRNVDLPCCYPAKTCTTGINECPRCRFTYCDHHFTAHAYRFTLPRHVGQAIHDELRGKIARAAENPRQHRAIVMRVPPIAGLLP